MTKLIAVFCASNADEIPSLVEAAESLVDEIAERGLGVVYGGARVGLMGVVARRALARGIPTVGVIPRRLLDRELLMPGLSDTHIVETMAERKAVMAQTASAFVALPGAIGTLDEIVEQWTLHYLGEHDKPIGFLDVEGYWQPLFDALAAMSQRGVVRPAHLAIPRVHTEPHALLDALLG